MSDQNIIKAQQGLARKAQVQRSHRFEDLYFLLCKREWISEALDHVLNNPGAFTPGIDGQSRNDLEKPQARATLIDTLQAELKSQRYQPQPVRRVEIPKPGTHKKRPLGIQTIKDRTVQTLLKMLMEPIWEADFLYFSNGFRPARCTMDCIQPLYKLFGNQTRYRWVIEGDIRACFDSIPQDKLVEQIARRIADRKILNLITHFLKSGIMKEGQYIPSDTGVTQGGPLSPLLANIYLHRFDEWYNQTYAAPDPNMDKQGYTRWKHACAKGKQRAATQLFRFADDFILLVRGTRQQAQDIKQACQQFFTQELTLELSEEKTQISHISEGFNFLGYHIFRNQHPENKHKVGVFIQPTSKNLQRIKLKIKEMTDRSTLWDDYLNKIKAINAVVRGWANYYRAVNAYAAFRELDEHVWLRLGRWLAKKHHCGPLEVQRTYMQRQSGPQGGMMEYAAQDETGQWVWRYRATQTPLVYYRPSFKKHWPNPYLHQLTVEAYELPSLKTMWTGYSEAPILDASRREVLRRANGHCERCGKQTKLIVHHQHRVRKGHRSLEQADHRPSMLEALCFDCHVAEHRPENIDKAKRIWTHHDHRVNTGGAPVAG